MIMEKKTRQLDEKFKIKYRHRALYLFLILVFFNILWDVFVTHPKAWKEIIYGILVPFCFTLFYFVIKNLKRNFANAPKNKLAFSHSILFIPLIYGLTLVSIYAFVNFFSAVIDNVNQADAKQRNSIGVTADWIIPETRESNIDNRVENYILFSNVFICKFTQIPVGLEVTNFVKRYHKGNYITRKETATTKMLGVSTFSTIIFQIFAVFLSEKVLYPIVRKRRKHKKTSKKQEATP